MSISNIQGQAERNKIRSLEDRIARLEAQISQVVKNSSNITQHSSLLSLDYASSGHSGFASSSDLTTHTGDSTIHFTEASIDHDNITNNADDKHVHVGTSAPSEVAGLWLDSSGGSGSYIFKFYNGSAWVTVVQG